MHGLYGWEQNLLCKTGFKTQARNIRCLNIYFCIPRSNKTIKKNNNNKCSVTFTLLFGRVSFKRFLFCTQINKLVINRRVVPHSFGNVHKDILHISYLAFTYGNSP
ncbi:hypothetical protein FKM82_002373 [Ascaphus truei]